MELTPHVQSISARLQAAAGADERSADVAQRMSLAIEAALELQLLDLLGQAALELTEQLPAGHIELRLAGRDAQLVYADDVAAHPQTATEDEGSPARLTLRMTESLKTAVEGAAALQGVSTNTWLVTAVKRTLEQRPQRKRSVGNRLTGYAQG